MTMTTRETTMAPPDERDETERIDGAEHEEEETEGDEEGGDETDEEPQRTITPRAPAAPGPPVHVHLGTPTARRGKGRGRGLHALAPTLAEAENARKREDAVQAFVGLFRTSAMTGGGFKLIVTRLKPPVWDFNDGRGQIGIKGYVEEIYDPADATQEYIRSRWGGGTYMLQVVGPSDQGKGLKHAESTNVDIAGDPLPGPQGTMPRQPSVPALPGVPSRISPEESRILSAAMGQQQQAAEREHEDLRRERERADALARENAALAAAAAKAEAKAESALSRLESIERRLNDGGGAAKKEESSLVMLLMDMRKEERREREEELKRRERDDERRLEARQSPMQDWIKQQADAHERERKAEAERQKAYLDQQQAMQKAALEQQKAFMEMQIKASEERAQRFLDELKEARAERKKPDDLVAQIEKLATLRESLDLLGGGNDEEESIGKTILKTLPEIAERFPQIGAGLRAAWTGQGVTNVPALPAGEPPPGAIGGVPPKDAATETQERAQAAMIARLITLLESTMANQRPHAEIAGAIRDKFPGQAIAAIVAEDPDLVLAELKKFIQPGSPLLSVAGSEHIRKTLDACREMLTNG
jgi:hypothetical protein